jgi:hypothetical protein
MILIRYDDRCHACVSRQFVIGDIDGIDQDRAGTARDRRRKKIGLNLGIITVPDA